MRTGIQLMVFVLLALFGALPAYSFDFPPWDTGHQSMEGDDGDPTTDPGNGDGCEIPPCACSGMSPVDARTGNFEYQLKSLLILGAGPALDLTLAYNSQSLRPSAFGQGWTHPYDARIIETTTGSAIVAICAKGDGRQELFNKNPDGSYSSALPRLRQTLRKLANGTYELRDRFGTIRRFSAEGLLSAIADRNGNALQISYDSTGFVTAITDASGRVISFTKGANGRVASVSDPSGRIFRFEYNTQGQLITYRDSGGAATTFQYTVASADPGGGGAVPKSRLSSITDANGNTQTRLSYDTSGRVSQWIDQQETWSFSYNPTARTTTKRDTAGNTWSFLYNVEGNVTRATDPFGKIEAWELSPEGEVLKYTNKNGAVTSYEYDIAGNRTATSDAVGGRRTIAYELNFNKPTRVTDARGNATVLTYDGKGNLTSITDPLSRTMTFSYNSRGLLLRAVDVQGQESAFEYDQYGNLVGATEPSGAKLTAVYDLIGNLLRVVDASGATTTMTYDPEGRLLTVTNAIGGRTQSEYDAEGNLLAHVSPNGIRTTMSYDLYNRLSAVVNSSGQRTLFSYNRRGQVSRRTDPKGQSHDMNYDALGRLVRRASSDNVTSYVYDSHGNLTSISDNDSGISYSYDSLNRPLEVRTTSTAAQPASVLRFTYDLDGNRTSRVDPSGETTLFSFDAVNRVNALTLAGGQSFQFQYDNLDRRTQLVRPSGSTTSYSYDRDSQLTQVANPAGRTFGYSYDIAGNIVTAVEPGGTEQYRYDSLSRLITATRSPSSVPTETYSYDGNGNRLASHLDSSHSYDGVGRLLATSRFSFQYDENGNLVRRADAQGRVTTFSYTSENQLSQVVLPDGRTVSYRYDALGRRIQRISSTGTTSFVYDGADVIAEYVAGSISARFFHGPQIDELLAVRRGGALYFAEADVTSSIRTMTTSDGTVHNSYQYDAFGRIIGQTGPSVSTYRFQGREWDEEVGLYYFRARYYDPEVGRFISGDPTGLVGGSNLYRFAGNNPLSMVDPEGLEGVGHHYVPKQVFDKPGISQDAFEVFDKATTGPTLPKHGWSKEHKAYNEAVQDAWNSYVKNNKIDVSKMTKAQAEEFLKGVRNSKNPAISKFMRETEERALRYAEKRAGKSLAKKAGGAICKKLGGPLTMVPFFLYDWADGGFGHAVNEATWPVSEAWQ